MTRSTNGSNGSGTAERKPQPATEPHEPARRRALGKGLESLLSRPLAKPGEAAPESPADAADRRQREAREAEERAAKERHARFKDPFEIDPEMAGSALEIHVTLIDPNPYQTRQAMDEEKLEELARSIAATGVVQPIIVRKLRSTMRFQLISGERRWRASQRAGKLTIPAILREVSDEQAMEMTIVENLQREDLNPMEQARAYERLGREFRMTQEQIATRTGKDRASVANFLRLMRLPDAVQKHLEKGDLSFGHAKALLALSSPGDIAEAAAEILSEGYSVRQAETLVQEMLNPERGDEGERKEKIVDPNVRDAEDRLQRQLGLKVRIQDKNGRGRIVIEYSRLEDFDNLMEALGAGG